MKNKVLSTINGVFYAPLRVKHCSQTIYQALIGCIRLYEATGERIWLERAEKVCAILISIQQPDGGFDIGYEFNFGLLHKKGESTSPELVGLSALVKFYKASKSKIAAEAAHKAANWIRQKAIRVNQNHWMIPYAPITTQEIMVYNGTSFAAGALGEYLSEFPDGELEVIYHGMINYLGSVMSPDYTGKFWFYSDQTRKDLSEKAFNKIDYYHQMQQVEMHSEAQFVNPDKHQKKMIEAASEHVATKQDKEGKIPYLNQNSDIHLWGFCSCASGFLLAGKLIGSKYNDYRSKAELIYNWIEKYSWNGEFFYPIISHDNVIIDDRFYVRSDAWVFNSFALAVKEGINADRYLEICEKSYEKIANVDFSGLENHASNRRKRTYTSLLKKAGKIKKSVWLK